MAIIKDFKGLRPRSDLAGKICELPYDVINTEEARSIAHKNEFSFYHITKPEVDLPEGTDPYEDSVYNMGKDNLLQFIQKGILIQDDSESLYLYTLIRDKHEQTGLIACVSADDYDNGVIKKHELTREDKEIDRYRHIDTIEAHTGPVFLLYREDGSKTSLFREALNIAPCYDVTAEDGVRHIIRIIDDKNLVEAFKKIFEKDTLYIADGHHRAASAVRVCMKRRKENPQYDGNEGFNFFLGVIFPHDQLKILSYNRVIQDLNNLTGDEFLERISERFNVEKTNNREPESVHNITMYIDSQWFSLLPDFRISSDPVSNLDVQILQENILGPILGIEDPRRDNRIDFVGGIKGCDELQRLVESGKYRVAFSMYPTSVQQLMNISDNNKIMPPKSTWFEPKLRSGFIVHLI